MMQLSHYPAALGEALAVRAASPTGEGIAQAAQRANEIRLSVDGSAAPN
jgi:hypothetical protein